MKGWFAAVIALVVLVWDVPGGARAPGRTPTTSVDADSLAELRSRRLALPVRGATQRDLHNSFHDIRRWFQIHEAIDILAPRSTPVLAVEDGTIARLFESKAGGTTVYQFDPGTRYVYYYAHLERYADGLREGHHVRRGQALGFVGTTGNAPTDTPHLHFAIFRLTAKKQWWKGRPINPYDVFKERATAAAGGCPQCDRPSGVSSGMLL